MKWGVAIALSLVSLSALGQQAFPTLKGGNARTGNNGNPAADNANTAALTWFYTGGQTTSQTQVVLTTTPAVGNASGVTSVGPWKYPANPGFSAVGFFPGDNPQTSYEYVAAIPSQRGSDPTVPQLGYIPSTFTWDLAPTQQTFAANSNTPAPGAYTVQVWLPTGSTTDPVQGLNFAQRYFVYSITDSAGNRYVDVVDRMANNNGWVTLTQGTGSSNSLFSYDGITPIKVSLYNTVPRDANGNLEGVSVNAAGNLSKVFWVYADAAQTVPNFASNPTQPIIVADPNNAPNGYRVYAAFNNAAAVNVGGQIVTETQGTLQALVSQIGSAATTPLWSFTVPNASQQFTTVAIPSAAVTVGPGWTTNAASAYSDGPQYDTQAITNNPANTSQVLYQPTLNDGSYDVYMWLPGTQVNYNYANQVQVEVDEGATAHLFTVNLQQSNGFYRLGTVAYSNSVLEPLVVKITNYSALAGDLGKFAYADAVRFVGTTNVAITSTPAYATVPINVGTTAGVQLLTKRVVVEAAEDGRIYCLDADGNGNGTTNIYWAYPSLPNPLNPAQQDPNSLGPDGLNGVILATMPTGFGKSSPVIAEDPVGSGHYYCYIASTNGRVYCIDMQGRGDNNFSQQVPGTTTRTWSYPNDYPATPVTSNLGNFQASVLEANPASGPTIYVPTMQGRIYALDAAGNPATKTTTVKWAYPTVNSPTIGPIAGTPAIDGNPLTLYFGTEITTNTAGAFYSVDADTGTVHWSQTNSAFDSFDGGPATAFGLVGDGNNYIYASNRNGYIYAFNDLGNILWSTNELNTGVSAPLLFTDLNVYNNAGTLFGVPQPTVMVPSDDGHYYGLFAATAQLNSVGTRLDYFYSTAAGSTSTGLASGFSQMLGTDDQGILYDFSSVNSYGNGGGPGSMGSPPNSPIAQSFKNFQIQFLTAAAYQQLTATASPNYSIVQNPANFVPQPAGFDFGQTMYVVVYNIPYNVGGEGAPSIDFTFNVPGMTTRSVPQTARQFTGAPNGEDGFVAMAYPIVVSGSSALTPGIGSVSFTINSPTPGGGRTQVIVNPNTERLNFQLANPLGIAINPTGAFGTVGNSLGADPTAFGNAASPQNAFNGVSSGGTAAEMLSEKLLAGTNMQAGGLFNDLSDPGTVSSTTLNIYDRSLMVLLNGPDIGGITNVRVARSTLGWQGGYNNVVNPVGGTNGLYPAIGLLSTFEQYPVNYPNDSLDYPDIKPESINVIKEPNGNTENPLFNGVTLEFPLAVFTKDANGNYTNTVVNDVTKRQPNPTPFEFDVSLPQFQPANLGTSQDALGNNQFAGYNGWMNVFVDRFNNGVFNANSGSRDADRGFMLASGVSVKQHISVLTPSVDLGPLAEGLGLTPTTTGSLPYTPWVVPGQPTVYSSFSAVNDGNTNLLNVRLAHATNNGNVYTPWPFYAAGNDALAWVDGSVNMWSDLDPTFSPSDLSGTLSRGEVFSVKPRTTDASGTSITSNPISRLTDLPLVNGYPVQNPEIAITPPIGTPVGQYSQIVRLIEDRTWNSGTPTAAPGYDLSLSLGQEQYSDPTLTLSFTVRETRLTNSSSSNVSTMMENLVPNGWTGGPLDGNVQPTATRDLFGNLIAAWSSNRPATGVGVLPSSTQSAFRLYFGGLLGQSPLNVAGSNVYRDLNAFSTSANGNPWFNLGGPYPYGPSAANAGGINGLFQAGVNEHVIGTVAGETDTATFGDPSFPTAGVVNPYNEGQSFANLIFGFTGSAQLQTPTGITSQNRLFLGTVTPVQGGAPTLGAVIPTPIVSDAPISKPSVIETQNSSTILYSTRETGNNRLFYLTYQNGPFGQPTPIDLGTGFLSASDPSGIARQYVGTDAAQVAQNGAVIDFVFAGHLRGQANTEIFMGRMPTDANAAPNKSNATQTLLSYFPQITNEVLTRGSTDPIGVYRTKGVNWNPNGTLALTLNGVALATTPSYDPNSGMYTYNDPAAGRVYLDSNTGTVRFAGIIPTNSATVELSYQPQILRISSSAVQSYSRPTLSWDGHLAASNNYNGAGTIFDRGWYNPDGSNATLANNAVRDDRYVVTFDKGSGGVGTRSIPMWMTLRIGISNPAPAGVNSASGPNQNYQYFTVGDEGNTITAGAGANLVTFVPTIVVENAEQALPIDKPGNETQVWSFLDPFDPQPYGSRRPPLVWNFWTSSRHGASDIYFETIAPALYKLSN